MDVIAHQLPATPVANESAELFHKLNNQLGIILSHAELLEAKAGDELSRNRSAQVVKSALEAMTTTREIRRRTVGLHA
jgi:hypothetical protein